MNDGFLKKLGIDPEKDSVNTCIEKYRAASSGLTLTIMPHDSIGLILLCSDPKDAQKIKDYVDCLNEEPSMEDIIGIRKHQQRGTIKLQFIILKERIEKLFESGANARSMYKYLKEKKEFQGTYNSFCKAIREYLPELHRKYVFPYIKGGRNKVTKEMIESALNNED